MFTKCFAATSSQLTLKQRGPKHSDTHRAYLIFIELLSIDFSLVLRIFLILFLMFLTETTTYSSRLKNSFYVTAQIAVRYR